MRTSTRDPTEEGTVSSAAVPPTASREQDDGGLFASAATLALLRRRLVVRLKRLGLDSNESEELAQDAIGEAFLARGSFRGNPASREDAFAWMLGIARNMRIDRLRKRAFDVARWTPAALETLPDVRLVRGADEEEATRQLLEALRCLGSREASLVHVHHIEGASIRVLASRYHVTQSAIKLRLFRARRELQVLLRSGRHHGRRAP